MVRGLQVCDATPAPAIESIMTDHCIVSMVANTRPRNSLETCRSSCDILSTQLTATAAREIARNSSASLEIAHLAEDHIGAAVDHVADADGALVSFERNALAEPVRERSANEQANAGRSPQITDARRPAIENQLAEQAEQDLRRAASGRPSHRHQRDPRISGDERM